MRFCKSISLAGAIAGLLSLAIATPAMAGKTEALAKLVKALEAPRQHARYYVTKPTHIMAWCRRLLPQGLMDYVVNWASDQ